MNIWYVQLAFRRMRRIVARIAIAGFAVFAGVQMSLVPGTNAFFSDTAASAGNTMTAGTWIPILSMSVAPASPDGDNGFYATTPCVTLSYSGLSSGMTATIFYEFSDDGDPVAGGTVYAGTCVPVPDGNPTHFQAVAVNDANPTWKSATVSRDFKVDTMCPFVELTDPDDGDTLSGSVDIRGTVTDANPHHYWLVIQTLGGSTVAGPGTVNDASSFTDEDLMTWDTTAVSDGDYRIKLEARDAAGNKCPNQAPVPSDPEEDDDSVDWIEVHVSNTSPVGEGDVIINEVMWMGSVGHGNDEWIELLNTTGHDISIKNWNIEGAVSGSGHLEIAGGPGGPSADIVIPAYGYFLIANYDDGDSDSALAVSPDLVKSNLSLANDYDGNGALILKDSHGNTIDRTPAPSGSSWPDGYESSSLRKSMERNSDPGDGASPGDWHTCVDDGCNDGTFWKTDDGDDYGTPKAANLSENEHDTPDFAGFSEGDAGDSEDDVADYSLIELGLEEGDEAAETEESGDETVTEDEEDGNAEEALETEPVEEPGILEDPEAEPADTETVTDEEESAPAEEEESVADEDEKEPEVKKEEEKKQEIKKEEKDDEEVKTEEKEEEKTDDSDADVEE